MHGGGGGGDGGTSHSIWMQAVPGAVQRPHDALQHTVPASHVTLPHGSAVGGGDGAGGHAPAVAVVLAPVLALVELPLWGSLAAEQAAVSEGTRRRKRANPERFKVGLSCWRWW